jgi:hypothetical protein
MSEQSELGEQNEPVEEGHDEAGSTEKVAGIIEQVQGDRELGNIADVDGEVRKRLEEAGIEVSEDELSAIRASVRSSEPGQA